MAKKVTGTSQPKAKATKEPKQAPVTQVPQQQQELQTPPSTEQMEQQPVPNQEPDQTLSTEQLEKQPVLDQEPEQDEVSESENQPSVSNNVDRASQIRKGALEELAALRAASKARNAAKAPTKSESNRRKKDTANP